MNTKPAEFLALENWPDSNGAPFVQAYFASEAELVRYLDELYGRTIDDLPRGMRVWQSVGGRWTPVEGSDDVQA